MPWWQFRRLLDATHPDPIDAADAVTEAQLVVARMREARAQGRGVKPTASLVPNSWTNADGYSL